MNPQPRQDPDPSAPTRWLGGGPQQHEFQRYLATIRERAWVVALTTLVAVVGVVIYLMVADKVYEAEADLLITPVPREDTTLAGLGLIRESSDPSRDVETAATLVLSEEVIDRAERRTGITGAEIRADPVADSNIVTVTVQAATPAAATALANQVARTAIERRTREFHRQLNQAIAAVQSRLTGPGGAAGTAGDSLQAELARLQTLRGSDDPTMRMETPATESATPVWPKPALSVIAAILGGLIVGIGATFVLQALDPRLRREEDLRRIFQLPILARIPKEASQPGTALAPERLSGPSIEAFRALRATIASSHHGEGRGSVLVTGASPSEGKTTVSINLAASLALSGRSVVLIEADLRRPAVGKSFGVEMPSNGIVSVLLEQVSLEHALVAPQRYEGNLKLLLVDQAGEWMADRLSLPAAKMLVAEARKLADFVIVDSPPLIQVIDALPLVREVDDVILVAGLERSNERKLVELGELLTQHGVTPTGVVLVGVPQPRAGSGSYYYTQASREAGPDGAPDPRWGKQADRAP